MKHMPGSSGEPSLPLSLHGMWMQLSYRPWPVGWEVGRPSIGERQAP